MVQQFEGQLEIDARRGVVYFHDSKGMTRLRICRLPEWTGLSPVDGGTSLDDAEFVDITAPEHVSYVRHHANA